MGTTGATLSAGQEGILTDAFHLKPVAAIDHLRQKGFAVTWNWHDQWQEAHQRAFTVAKVMQMDILEDIRSAVDKATFEGWSFARFQKELEPQLKAKGWWGKQEIVDKETGEVKKVQLGSPYRLETIYDTNLRTQYAVGKWQGQWANRANRPFIQMHSVIDNKTTERCRALNGLIFHIDDPILDKLYPPGHFKCRRTTSTLSQRNLDSQGLKVEQTDGKVLQKEVKVGDRTATVTGYKTDRRDKDGNPIVFWNEPGFDYNPGKVGFQPDLTKYDKDIVEQFKRTQQRFEKIPGEPVEPLLTRIPVKSSADIETVLNQYNQDYPGEFKNGFKKVVFDQKNHFMATDCHGTVFISAKKSFCGLQPKKDLTSALKKISSGKELVFEEEYAIESLWHEILHNRASGRELYKEYSVQHLSVETLNQFVARHTYQDFLRRLGRTAKFSDEVITKGFGYRSWVTNFREILSQLGLKEKSILGRLRNISFNSRWSTIHQDIAKEIAALSKVNATKVESLLGMLRKQPDDFKKLIQQVLQ
jgi:SPP1 gp7 family putative phage head morphogenesis protein